MKLLDWDRTHPDNTPVSVPLEVVEQAAAAAMKFHKARMKVELERFNAIRPGAKAHPATLTDAEREAKAKAEAGAKAKAEADAEARAKVIAAAEKKALLKVEADMRQYLYDDELSLARGKATASDRNLNIVGASSSSSSSWAEGWVSRNTKNWKADELTAEDWSADGGSASADCFRWQ